MIIWLKVKISIIVSTCFAKLSFTVWFSPFFTFTVILKSLSRVHRHYHGNRGFAAMLFLYYWIEALQLELHNLRIYLLPKHPFLYTYHWIFSITIYLDLYRFKIKWSTFNWFKMVDALRWRMVPDPSLMIVDVIGTSLLLLKIFMRYLLGTFLFKYILTLRSKIDGIWILPIN